MSQERVVTSVRKKLEKALKLLGSAYEVMVKNDLNYTKVDISEITSLSHLLEKIEGVYFQKRKRKSSR